LCSTNVRAQLIVHEGKAPKVRGHSAEQNPVLT